jgi:hypothetical protein
MFPTMLAVIAGVSSLQFPGTPYSPTHPHSVVAQLSECRPSHPQGSATPVARTARGADRALVNVERVSVDRNAIDSTIEALQLLDAHGQDGVVLWVGVIEGRRARVLIAGVLVHDATDTEADVSVVSRDNLERMDHALSQSGLRLIAEVHSGTTAILDSGLPDGYAVAATDGALVLIVPTRSPDADPTRWTAYRRFNGGFRSLSANQMLKLLRVDLESVRSRMGDGTATRQQK